VIKKIKMFLWSLGVLKETKCPICNSKLLPLGYPDQDTFEQEYKCIKKDCKFNEV
jgi:transposase-like protein